MSAKKERLKRKVEAAKKRKMEEQLEVWRKDADLATADVACYFPRLEREDIVKARPLFRAADVVVIGKWKDSHDVACYFCSEEFDEREGENADPYNGGDGGSICPSCLEEQKAT